MTAMLKPGKTKAAALMRSSERGGQPTHPLGEVGRDHDTLRLDALHASAPPR